MTKTELSYLGIGQTLLTHFDNQESLWDTLVPVVNTVNEVRSYVNAIKQESQTQGNGTTGHTQDKDSQKKVMGDLALSLIHKIRPFAKINKNNVLLAAVDFSESELLRGAEQVVINRCQTIHEQGQIFLSKLGDYQVTTENLLAFLTAINTFQPMTPQRNTVGDSRTTATANIKLFVSNLRDRLELLDDLVPGLISNANFVATYRQGRQLTVRGARKTKPPVA